MNLTKYYVATGVSTIALIVAVSSYVVGNLEVQKTWLEGQKRKQEMINDTEIKKTALANQKDLAKTAQKNNIPQMNSFVVGGYTANDKQPPIYSWSNIRSPEERLVTDQYGACIGRFQNGIFYSIYDYPQKPDDVKFDSEACDSFSQ